MHELKKQVEKDLKEFESGKKQLSGGTVDLVYKLSCILKNLYKIDMLKEESGYSEEGYGQSSYARGRRNARRDRMGRYTSYGMEGYPEDGYSEDGGSYRSSYGGAKDHFMSKLGEMMEEADPETRKALKKCMQEIEGE